MGRDVRGGGDCDHIGLEVDGVCGACHEKLDKGRTIFFVPQTGVISRDPQRSNFYVYRLADKCLAKLQIEVNRATVGSAGLEYDKEFLIWLEGQDTAWNQTSGIDRAAS
jgi:hypothetical protein